MEQSPRPAPRRTPEPDREPARDVTIPAEDINKLAKFYQKYTDDFGEPAVREMTVAAIEPHRTDLLPFRPGWELRLGPLLIVGTWPAE